MPSLTRPLGAALLCLLGALGSAAQAAGPSSTGVDAGGVPLAPGAVDAHYTVSGGGLTDAPTYATQNATGYPGYWLAPDSLSSWITPGLAGSDAANQLQHVYTYTTRFDLSGYDPATARIDGRVAVDDSLRHILLNGQMLDITASSYGSFRSFAITSGFVAGVNTLSFVVGNDYGGPTGLRAELATTLVPVPEPAAALLMTVGCGVLLLRRRVARPAAHTAA